MRATLGKTLRAKYFRKNTSWKTLQEKTLCGGKKPVLFIYLFIYKLSIKCSNYSVFQKIIDELINHRSQIPLAKNPKSKSQNFNDSFRKIDN